MDFGVNMDAVDWVVTQHFDVSGRVGEEFRRL